MKPINTKRSLRNSLYVGYASIIAMLGLFGGWAAMSNINGAVIASATLVVESYSKKVQHVNGGVVSRILIKDGDRVTEGQDLIILDPTDAKAELAITDSALDELLIKRARLEAQRDGQVTMALVPEIEVRKNDVELAKIINGQLNLLQSAAESERGKTEQLKQQIDQLNEQISGVEAQAKSKTEQSKLINEELKGLQKLQTKGLVPKSRVLAVEREAVRLEGEQGELKATRASAQSRIGEIKLRILQLSEDTKTQALGELRDVESKISELKERRVALSSRLTRTSIKAPITGAIYQLATHTEGGVIGAGETLMLIVPEGDDLVLQAMVSPNDIDQISEGQQAQVRFPSFNARLTPEVTAEVTQVAADTSRADANSPPFYAVRLIIPVKELKKLGDSKLKPGMTAEAFIQTDSRSPLSYLMKPLADQFARAMRED